jgi:MYXO-CTERM domain-containing protein
LNAASVATFVTGSLAGGPHTISATYAGDANHEGGILGTLIQVVDPAPTTVTLASSANPAIFGQRLTLTATAASGPMAPFSGTVTFLNGAVALGTSSIDASGKATLSVSSLGIATHALRAVFGGDLSHAASTSAALSEVVGVVQTKTALASSSNPAVVGKTLTFTATVSPVAPGAGLPTGMVTFSDGKTAFGGAVLDENGVASLDTGSLDEGAHTITAAYGGDGTYGPSKSDALTQRLAVQVTTVVVTSSPSPSTFGASVVLTATVDGSVATPTGKVTFRDGTTALGDASLDASGAASFSTTTLDVGTHTLSAEYAGDGANTAGSGTVSQVVGAAVTTTAVVSDEIRSFAGEAVTFTATVTSEVTGFSGDVEFLDGTASLGVVSLSGSTATLQTAALAQGGHAITAAYKGDARFAPSTSEALTETVQASLSTAGDAGVGRDAGTRGELPADAGPPAEGGAATRKDPFLRDTGSGCDCRLEPASRARGESSLAAVVLATLLTLRRRRKARDN